MTKEEIKRELVQLKQQHQACIGSACNVYGKNRLFSSLSSPVRINGCCHVAVNACKDSISGESLSQRGKKGFTLLELVISVLIVVILASIAWPQYLKAVERSRMSEAVALLATIGSAQERKFMQNNRYATSYTGLDVAPKGASSNKYCTKGTAVPAAYISNACGRESGFVVELSSDVAYNTGKAKALRAGPGELQYAYELERYYANFGTLCTGLNENGESLCADFCGIDTYQGPCCMVGGMNISDGDRACGIPSVNLHGETPAPEETEE